MIAEKFSEHIVFEKIEQINFNRTRPGETSNLADKQISITGRCQRNFGRCGQHQ